MKNINYLNVGYFVIVQLFTVTISHADETYSIFNPTPDERLRPMTTERPSRTDSPYSIDAGQIQIEANIYGFARNDDCHNNSCTETKRHTIGGSTNFRIGLTNNTDIQFITDLYQHQTINDRSDSSTIRQQGLGDTTIRLKINVIGNNPSDTFSLAVLPYVTLPTHQDDLGNNEVEGGLGLPFNIAFANNWNIGGMTQFNFISEIDGSGYDIAYANSVIVGKGLTDKLSAYGEYYTYKADQSGAEWENTLGFGSIYQLSKKISVDANLQFGTTNTADDVNLFFGGAYRF